LASETPTVIAGKYEVLTGPVPPAARELVARMIGAGRKSARRTSGDEDRASPTRSGRAGRGALSRGLPPNGCDGYTRRMAIRLASVNGRAQLVRGDRLLDVERTSGGRFAADPMAAVGTWDALCDWGAGLATDRFDHPVDRTRFDPPVPHPAKVFAIGLNYRAHAEEAGLEIPKAPMVFTKFPNCLAGPHARVALSSGFVDYEAELVVVVGRRAKAVAAERALDVVAGYCAGQDVSDRRLQFSDKPAQFSLGKSLDGFGPRWCRPMGSAIRTISRLPAR
jgi:Fumarylacetoacetate (FAA) hydrolase family